MAKVKISDKSNSITAEGSIEVETDKNVLPSDLSKVKLNKVQTSDYNIAYTIKNDH